MKVIFRGNTQSVKLLGFEDADAATTTYLNAADVDARLIDSAGAEVAGSPASMAYVAGSDGDYSGSIASTVTLTLLGHYTLEVTAVEGPITALWEIPVRVERREET